MSKLRISCAELKTVSVPSMFSTFSTSLAMSHGFLHIYSHMQKNLASCHPALQTLAKQGEPENPKDKPDTRKPIFNVRWMLRVHFVIWVTISTWEPKRTSNGTATSLPPSPVSDCHAYNSSAFFSCQTDTTHQKTGKTLKSGVASFLPKKWDSTFTSVLVLASQQFKHLKCS